MCGIAGDVRLDGAPDEAAVRRMAARIRHRGPDADGFYRDGPAALAHLRLSILDHAGGAQPMLREGCAVVFNGEAYRFEEVRRDLVARGHAFETRSDTEVVLRAYLEWGESFVEHVDGMFAIAIWDGRARKLLLARDRMGKKPLYYAVAGGRSWRTEPPDPRSATHDPGADRLVFASELKAFTAHPDVPRELAPAALVRYLAVEYVPAPWSIHQAIFKLPAASVAVLDERGLRVRRYWSVPVPPRSGGAFSRRRAPARREAEVELVDRLERAVARRLVADVPVGVFLSGGVDSTAVAALAARHKERLATFAIGFEEASFDESSWARLAANAIGSDHHEERLSGQACVDLLPQAVEILDEPFADPSILPTLLLSRFVRRHVTVALAGDGGDELFAGYDTFLAHRPAALVSKFLSPKAIERASALAARLPSSSRNMSFDFRVKRFLRGVHVAPSLRHQAWIGSFLPEELADILAPSLRELAAPEVVWREVLDEARRAADGATGALPAEGSVDEALRFFLTRYLTDDILVKADRASMAASLEVRAPFLDTEVVEYVVGLPASYKLGPWTTKRLLKSSLRGVVPESILRRPKKGFGIPIAAWIRGPLRPMFEDLFSPRSLTGSGVLAPKATRALLDRHLSGRENLGKPLWTLASFLSWQRRWGSLADVG